MDSFLLVVVRYFHYELLIHTPAGLKQARACDPTSMPLGRPLADKVTLNDATTLKAAPPAVDPGIWQ
jgi:hypothetical protein